MSRIGWRFSRQMAAVAQKRMIAAVLTARREVMADKTLRWRPLSTV
jgi:hypothetical protein